MSRDLEALLAIQPTAFINSYTRPPPCLEDPDKLLLALSFALYTGLAEHNVMGSPDSFLSPQSRRYYIP